MEEIILGIGDHIIVLLFGIIIPVSTFLQSSQPEFKNLTFTTSEKLRVYYGNSAIQWLGVFIIMGLWWFNGRSFESLGLGLPQMSTTVWVLIVIFCMVYVTDSWWELRNPQKIQETKKKWLKDIPFLPANNRELLHFFVVAVTAGVCEEIIFRGYFIQYFTAWNSNNLLGEWLSIIIPAFLFAIGHVYQGHIAVIKTLLMAILFGWIFILSKSLWIPIILHFLVDAIGGYLAKVILNT